MKSVPRNMWLSLAVLAVALGGCILFTAGVDAYESFFTPAVDRSTGLPADKIYPQGRIFPFGGYSGSATREAANMFTLHGPSYGAANDFVIANAASSGMQAIYMVGIPMNFLAADGKPALYLTDQQIEAEIKRQVQAVVDNDVIAWWYLTPEEMRPWKYNEMAYLEVAARTIRENDPKQRPVWMYDPGHRTAGELAVTAQRLDIVGKGMYTNYSNQKGHRVWNRWTIEQQIAAIEKAGRPGAIQIAVPEMFQEPGPGELVKVPAWVRHDVYVALVAGAQGIVPFSLADRAGFSHEAWTAYYNSYAQIAQEINGEPGLGKVFLFGERRHDLQLSITAGEQIVSPRLSAGGITNVIEYPSVSMANIAYGSERYVFVVNSSEEPVDVRIEGFPDQPVYMRDAFTGAPLPTVSSSIKLSMPGLGVSGFRFSQGYVWLASPQPRVTIDQPALPLQLEAPGLSLNNVKVTLDGTTLYEGSDLPADVSLRPAQMAVANHKLMVIVTDTAGKTQVYPFEFAVEHFRLISQLGYGERLAREVPLQFQRLVAPNEINDVTISLIPISEDKQVQERQLYKGTALPDVLPFITTEYEDGAYDLAVRMHTTFGISTERVYRLVIDNWTTLEDAILPAVTDSWFGTRDRLNAVDRSSGWEYCGEAADSFFGDDTRIRRQSPTEEYLTWQLPRLKRFSFVMYARRADVSDHVSVAVSADRVTWQPVLYTINAKTQPDSDWMQLELAGVLSERIQAEYIRLELSGSNSENHVTELGYAVITGEK